MDSNPENITRQRRWRMANPTAYRSHLAVAAALRVGKLVKPEACECCGHAGKLDGHHPDHNDPLRVVWLLRRCHVRLHAAERQIPRCEAAE